MLSTIPSSDKRATVTATLVSKLAATTNAALIIEAPKKYKAAKIVAIKKAKLEIVATVDSTATFVISDTYYADRLGVRLRKWIAR
ncbi:MAG TPA: hypothetical protein VE439_03340 [Anaerolineae bacterium]|jgi:hypothetical protein|nr:hypothetical protein [Anaerolineae bacterium]